MTVITPVTELLPYSNEILEKSSIPFACTITPYAPPSVDDSNKSSNSNSDKSDETLKTGSKLLRLSSVAKCGDCGSILNPSSPMLDYPSRNVYGSFLCGLCGCETTLHPDAQCDYNQQDDGDCNSMTSAYYIKRYENIVHGISTMNDSGMYGGKSSFNGNVRLKEVLPECYEEVMEYDMDHENESEEEENAESCPLLLILVIMYSSLSSASYYKSICECINELLDTAPSHVKIGIFIACPNQRMAVMDLSSAIPHWKHVFVNEEEEEDSCSLKNAGFEAEQIFWSLKKDTAKNHIEAVLRALGDSLVIHGTCGPNQSDHEGEENSNRVEIGSNIEAILDYIEYTGGYHPGSHEKGIWKYAGGKIFVFCNEPPKEIPYLETYGDIGTGGSGGSCSPIGRRRSPTTKSTSETAAADRFSQIQRNNIMSTLNLQEEELYGIFSSALSDVDSSTSLVDYFSNVGFRCCAMALGIDIFGLVSTASNQYHQENNQTGVLSELDKKVILGFPLLSILSERSGCGSTGPVLIQLPTHDNVTSTTVVSPLDIMEGDGGTLPALLKEVLCRCPWNTTTCFGAMLRIRTSQSFGIVKKNDYDQQESFYTKGGIIGPCSTDPIQNDLWHFGTCDLHTTLSFDLEILSNNGVIGDVAFTESHGDVELPSCIQTAFAYTAVIPRNTKRLAPLSSTGEEVQKEDIRWVVVRRLRVYTKKFSIARDTESFMMSLHPEVMAMTLFHKLFSMSLTLGFDETQILAKDWLLSLLLSTYKSALHYFSRYNTNITNSKPPSMHSVFSPTERLLHIPGSNLSPRDILIAAGHPKLSTLPLIVYSLLLSDALHPLSYKSTYYYPTIDARCAAASNMYSMTPTAFFKCIVPTISLYALNTTTSTNVHTTSSIQCIVESLPRSKLLIQKAVEDQRRFCVDNNQNENMILVLDSTKHILSHRYSFSSPIVEHNSTVPDEQGNTTNNNSASVQTATSTTISSDCTISNGSNNIIYHPALTQLLEDKMKQYKFPPPIHTIQSSSLFSSCNSSNATAPKSNDNMTSSFSPIDSTSKEGLNHHRLLDAFIEDIELDSGSNNSSSHFTNLSGSQGNNNNNNPKIQNFQQWCDLFAEMVHEEINGARTGA